MEPLLKLLQGAQSTTTPSPAIPQFIAQQTAPAAISTTPATIPTPTPAIAQATAQSMPQPAKSTAATAPKRGRRSEETEAKVNQSQSDH